MRRSGDDFFGNQGGAISGLLHLFSGTETSDGLSSELGRPAALFALVLAALAAAAWARPDLANRLPLGTCALLAGYFGLAVAVQTRSEIQQPGVVYDYAYGAYVGVGAAIVVFGAAGVLRRGELARYRRASVIAMLVLVGGLLVAFLLPWWEWEWPAAGLGQMTAIGLASPAAVVAAALTLCLPGAWSGTGPAERLALAVMVALFTGAAAAGSTDVYGARAYGLWAALGIAGALVVVAAALGPRTSETARRSLAGARHGRRRSALPRRAVSALAELVLWSGERAAFRALHRDERLDGGSDCCSCGCCPRRRNSSRCSPATPPSLVGG